MTDRGLPNYNVVVRRIFAQVVDLSILLVVLLVLAPAFGDWSLLPFLLIAFGYYVALEAATGSTLGKMAFGLRVVKANGEPYHIGAVLLRNILRLIDGIFFYLVG